MPYIKATDRYELAHGRQPYSPGELNYAITQLVIHYVEARESSYTTLNDVLGALEAAKLEFYRRVVVPYERVKIDENGDVYTWGSGARSDGNQHRDLPMTCVVGEGVGL